MNKETIIRINQITRYSRFKLALLISNSKIKPKGNISSTLSKKPNFITPSKVLNIGVIPKRMKGTIINVVAVPTVLDNKPKTKPSTR